MKRFIGVLIFGFAFFFVYKVAYWNLTEGKSFATGIAVAFATSILSFGFAIFGKGPESLMLKRKNHRFH